MPDLQIDINDVLSGVRTQMAADYGRLNVDLAVARAEAAALRLQVARLEDELDRTRGHSNGHAGKVVEGVIAD